MASGNCESLTLSLRDQDFLFPHFQEIELDDGDVDDEEMVLNIGRGRLETRMVPRLPKVAVAMKVARLMQAGEGNSGASQKPRGRGRARLMRDRSLALQQAKVGSFQINSSVPEATCTDASRTHVPVFCPPRVPREWSDQDFPALGSQENRRTGTHLKPKPLSKPNFKDIQNQHPIEYGLAQRNIEFREHQYVKDSFLQLYSSHSNQDEVGIEDVLNPENDGDWPKKAGKRGSKKNSEDTQTNNTLFAHACESDVDTGHTLVTEIRNVSNNAKEEEEEDFVMEMYQYCKKQRQVKLPKKANPYRDVEVTLEDIQKIQEEKLATVTAVDSESVEIGSTDLNVSDNNENDLPASDEIYISSQSSLHLQTHSQSDSGDAKLQHNCDAAGVENQMSGQDTHSQESFVSMSEYPALSQENPLSALDVSIQESTLSSQDVFLSALDGPLPSEECPEPDEEYPVADGECQVVDEECRVADEECPVVDEEWSLIGDFVIQVDGIPVFADLSGLMELVTNFGEVSDQEIKVHDSTISIRFKMTEENVCDSAVHGLADLACCTLADCSGLVCYQATET